MKQPQTFDEIPRKRRPIHGRAGDDMGVVVAGRAVGLTKDGNRPKTHQMPLKARHKHRELLAGGGGGGRLAVGARQHRHVRRGGGEAGDGVDDFAHGRREHFRPGPFQQGAVGEVVDVLGRAGEMHELDVPGQPIDGGDALLDEVLHCLHVVVGFTFQIADALGVGHRERPPDGLTGAALVAIQWRHDRAGWRRREAQQPFHLNHHPLPHQPELADDRGEGRDAGAVAAVQRRDGGERRRGGHA